MKNNLIIETAHNLLNQYICSTDTIVDATMGNGHDTLFLSQRAKFVYAFDIQDQAIAETKKLLDNHSIHNVKLIKDSHEHILNYIHDFKGVIFNLGYLPNGDKQITTTKDTTLKAIENILPTLKKDGFILIVVYPGHKQGMEESIELSKYFQTLNQNIFKVLRTDLPFQDNQPPLIYFILKVKDESH